MTGDPPALPGFLQLAIGQLRRCGLPIGVDDCRDLRLALATGFGWTQPEGMRELCVALWAKSRPEADLIRSVMIGAQPSSSEQDATATSTAPGYTPTEKESEADLSVKPVRSVLGGSASLPTSGCSDRSLVLVPRYAVTDRDIAQAWRTLRRPSRHGPRTEVDVVATINRRAETAVATPPVLVPPRRNTIRVLLLIDRQGSMTPYHGLVDHARRVIERTGRLDSVTVAYFRNVPGHVADRRVLERLRDPFAPQLDDIVSLIPPIADGWVYSDPDLTEPREFAAMLSALDTNVVAAVISDAGASRGRLDTTRLLDTVGMLKALRECAQSMVWLNPAPARRWTRSTAEQVARHVAMFPWTRVGFEKAASVLNGRPSHVEYPV